MKDNKRMPINPPFFLKGRKKLSFRNPTQVNYCEFNQVEQGIQKNEDNLEHSITIQSESKEQM